MKITKEELLKTFLELIAGIVITTAVYLCISVSISLQTIGERLDEINATIIELEARFDVLDQRVTLLEQETNHLEECLKTLETEATSLKKLEQYRINLYYD